MSATTLSHIRQPQIQSTSASQNLQLLTSTDATMKNSKIKTVSSIIGKSSIGSNSEASDPLESDYSGEDGDDDDDEVDEEEEDNDDEEEDDEEDEEEEDEDDVEEVNSTIHKNAVHSQVSKDTNDDDNDDDEDEEEEEDEEEDEEDDDDDEEETEGAHNILDIEKNCKKGNRVYDLDDLQIIKTIGTGTFGRVYLVKDKQTDTYCAMKILSMTDVIRLKQVDHVKNEKSILTEVQHPFIVNLKWSTKDDCCLYMLFEYVCGGELFSYLRNAGRFSSQTANFYSSEIILALEYLHSLSIVYRDLKPENLLINRDGHLKITDFGFAKKLKDRTWTLCGTPEYLAPEIIQSKGHNRAVDWWALGVLIYEMLVGYPPFYDDNPFGIYEKILSGKIEWPRHMDPVAKDLIKKLLVLDRTKRMGNMKNGAEDVKRHRWFKHLNWNDVLNKKLTPPIMPEVNFDGDTSNFDEYPETDWKPARSLNQSDMQLFNDF